MDLDFDLSSGGGCGGRRAGSTRRALRLRVATGGGDALPARSASITSGVSDEAVENALEGLQIPFSYGLDPA